MSQLSCLLFLVPAPLLLFIFVMRKSLRDKELGRAMLWGICMGVGAAASARLAYLPIEACLGSTVRAFISQNHSACVTFAACTGIIGLVEETAKIAFGLLAYLSACTFFVFRPTALFISLAACALTFSTAENIQYLAMFGPIIIVPRILISSVAHFFFAVSASLVIKGSLKKCAQKKRLSADFYIKIVIGIFIAALWHGFFDFLLFQYNVDPTHGVIAYLSVFFLYAAKECYTEMLKDDLPEDAAISLCTVCGAVSLEPARFCCICGSRLVRHKLNKKC